MNQTRMTIIKVMKMMMMMIMMIGGRTKRGPGPE